MDTRLKTSLDCLSIIRRDEYRSGRFLDPRGLELRSELARLVVLSKVRASDHPDINDLVRIEDENDVTPLGVDFLIPDLHVARLLRIYVNRRMRQPRSARHFGE